MADNQIHTGGGSAISGNVETGGGGFAGRDSQRNDIRIEANQSDYRITSLETRMTIFEGRFEDLREEVRDEVRKQAGTTWHYWVAIIAAVAVVITLLFFIVRLDTAISLLERRAPVEQSSK